MFPQTARAIVYLGTACFLLRHMWRTTWKAAVNHWMWHQGCGIGRLNVHKHCDAGKIEALQGQQGQG